MVVPPEPCESTTLSKAQGHLSGIQSLSHVFYHLDGAPGIGHPTMLIRCSAENEGYGRPLVVRAGVE